VRAVATVLAVVLVALGVGLYLVSGRESVTALIPAFFGVAFGLCAALATTPTRRKHAMHAAAVLALLGVGGSARGIPDAVTLLGGGSVERPAAAWGQVAMMLLCLVFLVLAVRSFVAARRARKAREGALP
jgi:hypothetical protein